MATIRVTRELLEYALDLPEGVQLLDALVSWTTVEGVQCLTFMTAGGTADLPAEGSFALQYEETETGMQLALAVPLD